jgi:hypothetical protein
VQLHHFDSLPLSEYVLPSHLASSSFGGSAVWKTHQEQEIKPVLLGLGKRLLVSDFALTCAHAAGLLLSSMSMSWYHDCWAT